MKYPVVSTLPELELESPVDAEVEADLVEVARVVEGAEEVAATLTLTLTAAGVVVAAALEEALVLVGS